MPPRPSSPSSTYGPSRSAGSSERCRRDSDGAVVRSVASIVALPQCLPGHTPPASTSALFRLALQLAERLVEPSFVGWRVVRPGRQVGPPVQLAEGVGLGLGA